MNKKETEKFYKTTMMEEVDKIPLPKDFKSWIDSKVFRHFNRMIIERIAPKKYFGSCQHCQSVNIELDNVYRHLRKEVHLHTAPLTYNIHLVARTQTLFPYLSFLGFLNMYNFYMDIHTTYLNIYYLAILHN